ncbi:MAG: ribonuclease Z [Candidatus Pacearchaeota archaeon]
MKITINILGTSSAIPTKTRNHISNLINYKDENILIDCGEGTQRQFRKANLNPCKITRLLITHFHGDHIFGLQGLFQTLALNDYRKTLYIYGPKGTNNFIKKTFSTYINTKRINYKIEEVNGTFFENKDFKLSAISLEHDAPTNGYAFIEKDKIRIDKEKLKKLNLNKRNPELAKLAKGKDIIIDGKKIKAKELIYLQKGKKISFIFDTRLCKNAKKLAKDSDLAIIEASFLHESENGNELAKEYKHLTAKQAAEIAKLNNVKKLVLTHISQRYENKENLLLEEAKRIFQNTIIAEDLMKIEV